RRVLFRSLRRHASHALRGRVGGDEVGPLLLDPAKIQDQRVELRIRDLGLVEHEVGVLMTPDLVAQSFRPLLNVSSPLAGRSGVSSPLAGRPGGEVGSTHFVSGASLANRSLRPSLSNFTDSLS